MTIIVRRQVGSDPAWEPSNAFRQWMAEVSSALNATATSGGNWQNKIVRVASAPTVGGNSPSIFGLGAAPTFSSSVTMAAGGSYLASYSRLLSTTAAPANSGAAVLFNSASPLLWLGDTAGRGGFRVEWMVGIETTQSTLRAFAGVINAALTVASTEPSAKTDFIALACDSADTNMQVMHNDSAGTATKIDLGASFPKTTGATYRVVFEAAANASSVAYTITRLDTAASATGTISTDLPATSVLMYPAFAVSNGATASAASLAFIKLQLEQD